MHKSPFWGRKMQAAGQKPSTDFCKASGQQPKPFQQSRWQIASIRNDSITGQQVSARFRGGTNETSRAIRERPAKSPGQRREKPQGQDQNNYRAPRSSRSQVGASRPSQWQTNIETDATRGKLSKRESKRAKNDDFERLAKVIAQAGVASRRKSEDLVAQGAVKVNGRTVLIPQHMVLPSIDEIVVNGKPLPRSTKKYYFVLNKPKGYLCSNQGFKEQETPRLVIDLFKGWLSEEWKMRHPHPNAQPPRLFTVGRLDVQTTGLILVTNDGEWAQEVQHPSKNLTKEYIVSYTRQPSRADFEALAAGCEVDGKHVRPVSLSYAAPDRKDKIRIVVSEGRNREIRALSEHAKLEVLALKRVRIGAFRLPKDLGLGEFRELKPSHIKKVTDRGAALNPQLTS